MKLQAPQGTASGNIGGVEFTVDPKTGICDVPDTIVKELTDSHGFIVAGQKQAPAAEVIDDKFTDMNRAEVIGYIKGKGVPFQPSTDTENLRALARSQYSPEERAADEAAAAAAKAAAK